VTTKQAPRAAVATLDESASADKHVVLVVGRDVSDQCQPGANAVVVTSVDAKVAQTNAFYIVFY
jgi:hypothetical protein